MEHLCKTRRILEDPTYYILRLVYHVIKCYGACFLFLQSRTEMAVAAPSIDTRLRIRGWRKSLVARPTHRESDLMCQSWARFRRAAYLKSRARLRSGTEGGSAREEREPEERREDLVALLEEDRRDASVRPRPLPETLPEETGSSRGIIVSSRRLKEPNALLSPSRVVRDFERVFRVYASSRRSRGPITLRHRHIDHHRDRSSAWDFRRRYVADERSCCTTLPTRGHFRQDKVRTSDAIN